MPDVLIDHETALDVLVEREVDVVVEQPEPAETIVTEGLQGPPGPIGPIGPAGGAAFVRQSSGALSALLIVWEDDAGVVRPLDSSDEAHIDLICGLTLTAAAGPGDVTVQRSGPVDDAAWSWAPGRVYLGANGALTQAPPADGFDVLIGVAVSATRLFLNLQDPIELE